MSFAKRFYFFSFGIFLGVIIIFLSLGDRIQKISFDYFPNNRIKKYLIQNPVFYSDKALCQINCMRLDTAFLDEYISNSNVDFSKSKIRGYDTKEYFLSFIFPKFGVKEMSFLKFKKHNDSITLIDVFINLGIPYNDTSTHPGKSKLDCEDCY